MTTNSQKPPIFLGVDGGGTKTSAWIATAKFVTDATGSLENQANSSVIAGAPGASGHSRKYLVVDQILGRGESGPGNPKPIGFEAIFKNFQEAIGQAMQQAGLGHGMANLDGGCFGLAGVGRPEEKQIVENWLRSQGLKEHWLVTDDIEPIRWAAIEEWRRAAGEGQTSNESDAVHLSGNEPESPWAKSVSVIAGTGSIAQGYVESGEKFRAGGWGYMLGDEGSGFAIALAGLKAICQAHDQRKPLVAWQKEILQQLQLETPEHLIGWIYQIPIPRRQLANLAEIVLAHRHSDPTANQIAVEAVAAWRDLVVLCCEKIKVKTGFGLALTGGIPNSAPDLVEKLIDDLEAVGVKPSNYQIVTTPVLGCLALAIDRYSANRYSAAK